MGHVLTFYLQDARNVDTLVAAAAKRVRDFSEITHLCAYLTSVRMFTPDVLGKLRSLCNPGVGSRALRLGIGVPTSGALGEWNGWGSLPGQWDHQNPARWALWTEPQVIPHITRLMAAAEPYADFWYLDNEMFWLERHRFVEAPTMRRNWLALSAAALRRVVRSRDKPVIVYHPAPQEAIVNGAPFQGSEWSDICGAFGPNLASSGARVVALSRYAPGLNNVSVEREIASLTQYGIAPENVLLGRMVKPGNWSLQELLSETHLAPLWLFAGSEHGLDGSLEG